MDEIIKTQVTARPVLVSDSSKARELLGWTPNYPDLDQQIAHAWTWFRDKTPNVMAASRRRAFWRTAANCHGRGRPGAACCGFACAPLLEAAAKAWVVHDVIQPPDAIVVLGGGLETRPFAAASLYKNGFAPKILVSDVKPSRAEKLGVVASHVREASSIFLSAVSSARFSSLDFLRDLSAILAEMVAAVGHVDFVITASCVGESTADTRSPCTLTEDAAQKYRGCCAEIRSTLYGYSKLVVERMLKEAEAVH